MSACDRCEHYDEFPHCASLCKFLYDASPCSYCDSHATEFPKCYDDCYLLKLLATLRNSHTDLSDPNFSIYDTYEICVPRRGL